jgi:hypothetical protein
MKSRAIDLLFLSIAGAAVARDLPVSFSPIADTKNVDPSPVIVKAHAPIADPQTEFRRMKAVKPLDVAGARSGETVKSFQDTHCDATVQRGQVPFWPEWKEPRV